MQDSNKFFWAFLTTFVVWLLGLFWHPFGYPINAWYWIFVSLMVVFGIGYFYCVNKESKPEDQEETEETV